MDNEFLTVSLGALKPHPLQRMFYDETSEADLKSLADDLRSRGQRDPVHVMPPGNAAGLEPYTILDGNRRVQAAAMVGLAEIRVLARHDLRDADAATVEAEFLRFNFLRRQLRPIQKARVALRLFLIEKKRPQGVMRTHDVPEARDRVGKAMGMSGRNLDRYFNVLRAPQAVQDAVDRGRLPLVLGSRVAGLPADTQQQIARQINSMTDPRAIARIVREHLGASHDQRHHKPNDALASFVRQLDRGVQDLDGRLNEVSPLAVRASSNTLRSARAVIACLLDRVDPSPASPGHRVRPTRRST